MLQKVLLRVVLVGGRKQMAEDPSAAELPDELVEGDGHQVQQEAVSV